jgi:DNA-binding Lrp family transcriptional regulator
MDENSLTAYSIYREQFKGDAKRILDYIATYPNGITAKQISLNLQMPINKVSGRMRDLKDAGVIKKVSINYHSKAPSNMYIIDNDNTQPEPKPHKFTEKQLYNYFITVYPKADVEFHLRQLKLIYKK